MRRAFFVLAITCGLIPAGAHQGRCAEDSERKDADQIALFITVIEETTNRQHRQIVSEPTLVTRVGRPTMFVVGGQVPDGTSYRDVSQRFEFLPVRLSGQTIWLEIKSEFSDYIKRGRQKGMQVDRERSTSGKFQIGKVNTSDSWTFNIRPESAMHIEFRIERMTDAEYERMMAEAASRARAKSK